MLEYDNSAFYYFAITLLIIYILPTTYYVLKEIFFAFIHGGDEIGAKARTKQELKKSIELKKQSTGFQRLNNATFISNLCFLILAWTIFLYLITLVSNDGEVNQFDPYNILGLEQGAATSDIKKSYRKLSLKYHPDKNIGDKAAEEMFMKIAKAYEALTDEAARENYEKYGNPDGKQSLEVSIGLPRILLDNPKVVLVLYLIAMVVIIPSVVGVWYANSKQYGEKNVKYETYSAFYTLLQESHRLKNIPEILAASAEFREINVPKKDEVEVMGLLMGKLKNDKLMVKPKFEHPNIIRGNLLLHAHLLQLTSSLTPALLKDLNSMLSLSFDLVEGLIEISYQRKWLETCIATIRFSQCLVQALWASSHSLEQLPHFGEQEIKAVTKGAKPQAKTLREYLKVADSDKKGFSSLSDEQKADVLNACKLITNLSIQTELFVEEEDKDFFDDAEVDEKEEAEKRRQREKDMDKKLLKKIRDAEAAAKLAAEKAPTGDQIFEQDLVTLRVTLTRENLTESTPSAAPVHAPHFPRTVYENFWLILTDKTPPASAKNAPADGVNVHSIEKISDQSRKVVHELRFMAPQRAGSYEMELQVLSDCYLGLDQTITLKLDVLPASELPEFAAHPEDLELDNDPTIFEQVMAGNVDESSDEEDNDDDEEDDEGNSSEKKAGPEEKKAPQSAGQRQQVQVDSEDEDEEDD